MPGSPSPSSQLDSDRALVMIRRLFADHALVQWKRYALAFGLMGIAAICTAVPAYLMGSLVNQAYVHHDFRGLVVLALVAALIFLAKGAATYGHTVIMSRIGNGIIAENQRRLFDKLLRENIAFFADRHSSEFAARLNTGAVAATQVLNLLITSVGRDFFSLVGLVVVMFVQDPALSIVTLLVCPPAFILLRKMIRRVRGIAKSQFTGGTRVLETLQETLQGMRIVKAFTLEDTMRARFAANVAAVEHEANKFARVASRTSPLMESLGGLGLALAILYGGYRVIETGATPGEFFSFLTAFLLASEPAKRLARLNLELHSGLVGVRTLFEVIDTPATEPDDTGRPPLSLTKARVEFSHVMFAYRPGQPVIRDLSLVAEPGQTTALVGQSGSGKSTILNLIARFYDVSAGSITIDGQNIASVSLRSLRRQIAYVGQDVFLFRTSIADNIGFGRPGATPDDIVAAAKAAHAHGFISRFPQGYDTPVGEHGLRLSGGERQRIAIARALIKNAPIILLDEATAALDSESEHQVQAAIGELCKGRTTIVIAHRLSTVVNADRILVIEAGQVVEAGRHEELMRKGGRYASFYRLQLKAQEPEEPPAAIRAV